MALQLVWFKKDLRLQDHAPLLQAAARGPVLCQYVYEPELYGADDFDPCHLVFINQSLTELAREIEALGGRLMMLHSPMPEALETLYSQQPFEALWSHEETGNDRSYQRDRRVAAWCRNRGLCWHEIPQTGVVRRLGNRDDWSRYWKQRMNRPVLPAPERLVAPAIDGVASCGLRFPKDLGLPDSTKIRALSGGSSRA